MATARKRNTKINSTEGKITAFKNAQKVVELPSHLKFSNESEAVVWASFTSIRSYDDWNEFDLSQLLKVVKIEVRIWAYELILDEDGPTTFKGENLVEHPILTTLTKLKGTQLSIMRSMGLTQPTVDKREIEKRAQNERDAKDTIEKRGPLSLLA